MAYSSPANLYLKWFYIKMKYFGLSRFVNGSQRILVYAAEVDYFAGYAKPPFFKVTGAKKEGLEMIALEPGSADYKKVEKWEGNPNLRIPRVSKTVNFLDESEVRKIM